ncbi:MAG: DUF4129 domain-containing protein [Acidimicrobiales bacterium]
MRRLAPVGAVLAVVAAAAAASSGVGIGSATLRHEPTAVTFTVAVTLGLAGMAICVALMVYAILRQERPSLGGFERSRAGWRGAIGALLGVAVFFGVLELLAHKHPHKAHLPAGLPLGIPHAHPQAHGTGLHFVPSASYATIGVIVAIGVLVVLVPYLRWALRRRRHLADLGSPVELSFPPPPEHTGGAGLLGALSAAEIADPADEPDVRRAVVKAWLSMARAGDDAGAGRGSSETAGEYLVRLLSLVGVSAPAAGRLTSLFELARYSSTEMSEEIRRDAVEALAAVRRELGAGAAA